MPRDNAKQDADAAVWFFDRCLARGLSRHEAIDLTVAYVLGRKFVDREKREPWQGPVDDEPAG